ncbi:uncharacterized protein BX663DRAFT_413217, partial [Cokeromyces recurvatus]|uniref:uncharacterized protein n=1 Tax=Cokeromyces recurvatus TaxID=90255 RepID=UPI0022201E11
ITPVDLPFFQWKGYVRDSSKPIFPTVDICLQNFEKVLRTYSLDLDKNWFRLMPMCLSGEQKMWYNE